jgi:methyl-accepting chemotaxis protein
VNLTAQTLTAQFRAQFRRSMGLVAKLVLTTTVISALVALILTVLATRQLRSYLERSHTKEGEAIALGVAAAAEQRLAGGASALQPLVEAFRGAEGLEYLYVVDASGGVLVHTFPGEFPVSLLPTNPLAPGELKEGERVKVAHEVRATVGGLPLSATDIAASIGAGGVVHVGMSLAHVGQEVQEVTWLMVAAALLLVATGVVVAMVLGRSIVRPLLELNAVASHIVESGDLTRPIKVTSGDEVGQMADSFAQMVDKLRDVTLNLQQAATALTQSTEHLNSSSTEQAQTISRQAAALQETQVTAQEIRQTSLLAAQKAESVLNVAERADNLARAGEAAIEQTMAGLNDIRAQVAEMAVKIMELGERTAQIGGITQTVKDLADQSNMLALNAAIESVRSGEHGKGFGVVAREIRALADQSIQATTRVRELLDDIANSISAAVRITETGAQRMETGLEQVRTSGKNLRELSGIVQDNASAVRQIAAAVNQQNVGINQITLAVNDLSKMMDETVARIGATGEAATTLQIISEQLGSAVKSYRVHND